MSEIPKPDPTDGRITLHPNSSLAKALELYGRIGVMADKRGFTPEATHALTALMLASCMLQAPDKASQTNTAKRVVERAMEIIDLGLLVTVEAEGGGRAG